MKLGKLLGAGKSFFGGQNGIAYRENKQVYLPKFNPGKNPFALKAVEPQSDAPVARVMTPAAAKTQKIATLPAPGPVRATNWAEKLNPFRAAKPVTAVPPETMPAVQPEFSLDAVKVVHNDLSDADVEVVPMKSRSAAPAPMPAAGPAEPMEFLGEPVMKSL